MRLVSSLATALVVAPLFLFATAETASAQSIIKSPGDHVKSVEIEPHLLLAPFGDFGTTGYGLGARVTFPIVDNGFVSTINNSIGIGVGFDWQHYPSGCASVNYPAIDAAGHYYTAHFDCPSINRFSIPVVMQWNFFLTRAWSVFGEPGLEASFYSTGCNGPYCPNLNTFDPVFYAGARWHFSQYTTLTMRVGWPSFSLGISFL